MVYVENKRKEILTKYLEDTPEVGTVMNLVPRKTLVPKKDKVGFT